MRIHPPSPTIGSPRRHASGRLHRTPSWTAAAAAAAAVAAVAVLAGACGSTPPSRMVTSTDAPTPSPNEALEGLLVATDGGIHLTDAGGVRSPFSQPDAVVISVSAGGGSVTAIDDAGRAWISSETASDPAPWRMLDLPGLEEPMARLASISPDGATLAMADGEFQGREFDLVLMDIRALDRRALTIDRGLDGPPIWLGNDLVAVHTLGPDQRSAMTIVDVASLTAGRDSVGYSLAATADGAKIAFDDPVTGQIRVGARRDWLAGRFDGMTQVPSVAGASVSGLSLDAAGTRLAVLRSTQTGATVELLFLRGHNWDSVRVIPLSTEGPVSIAWLR